MFDEIFEHVSREILFSPKIFGRTILISNTLVVMWIIMALIIIASILVTRNLTAGKPGKVQAVVELLTETVNNLCRGSAGHHGKTFAPYIGTLLVFLGVANIVTLLNFIPGFHLYPPTKDINVTGALAVMTIVIVIYSGFRYKGFKGWAKSLIQPTPVMAPFKILEYVTKPLSLCLRLFGNIVASFIIMELLYHVLTHLPIAGFVAPVLAAPFSAYFDIFDGVLQAFIFTYLTIIYIGEAVEE